MSAPSNNNVQISRIRDAVQQLNLEYRKAESEAPADTEEERFAEAERRAEAVLFAAGEPVSAEELSEALPQGVDASEILMRLKKTYAGRGVNLIEVAGKWQFRTAGDLAFLFVEEVEEARKLSPAALETLAIIAYCQPVTRAEIEDVRGVAVSKGTIDILMEIGWVRLRGRRKTPGRPATYGTTEDFLVHFGLENLDNLPGKSEFQTAGLLDSALPKNFEMPVPTGSAADEDPILPDAVDEDGSFHTDFLDESSEH